MRRFPRIVPTIAMVAVLILSGFLGMSPARPTADAQPASGQDRVAADANRVETQVTVPPFPGPGPTVTILNTLTLTVNGRTSSSISLHNDDSISATASTRFPANKRLRICSDEACSFVISQTAVTYATTASLSISARYAASFSPFRDAWVVVDTGNGVARATTFVGVLETRNFTVNGDTGETFADFGTQIILRSSTPGQYLPGYFEVYSDPNCRSFSQTWTAYRDANGEARYDATTVDDTASYRFQAASNGRYSQSNCVNVWGEAIVYPGLTLTINGLASNAIIQSGGTATLRVQTSPTYASNVVFHSYAGANCGRFVSSQAGTRSGDVYTLTRRILLSTTSYIATATTPGGSRVESLCRTVNVIFTLQAADTDSGSPSASPSPMPSGATTPAARPPRPGTEITPTATATASPPPSATSVTVPPRAATVPAVPTEPPPADTVPALPTEPPPTEAPASRPTRAPVLPPTPPGDPTRPPRGG